MKEKARDVRRIDKAKDNDKFSLNPDGMPLQRRNYGASILREHI